jgi:Tol biopolymer transport system component
MKKINSATTNKSTRSIYKINFHKSISKAALCCITVFVLIIMMTSTGGCFTMFEEKDTISNLSFSHDGKKVVFDRCRNDGCQIQVYDLETGELAAYQSPNNERWTMGKYSYDGKRITFSVIPIEPNDDLDLGGMQIAVMDTDGKNYKKVTTSPGAKLYPTFSHSGTKVLYTRAAFIRKKGRTPASQYDAWEVDLATGAQTQLTFFKYYYMGSLTYFPDDERFIYYGEMPTAFPGLDPTKVNPMDKQELIKQEQMKRNIGVGGVIVMKKGDTLPRENYNFGTKFFAKRPLLSKDGSKLIVEKDISGGKFFLYSPDGKHRLVGEGGSVSSAAISPDGGLLAFIAVSETMDISTVQDGKTKLSLYLPRTPKNIKNWPKDLKQEEKRLGYKFRMMPEKPSHILNQLSVRIR